MSIVDFVEGTEKNVKGIPDQLIKSDDKTVRVRVRVSPGVYEYLINVTIGTPPQNITLIIDTGSSDLWVNTNASCSAFDDSADAALCNQLGVYDPTNSSTFVNYTATDESFILNVTYLTGYVLGSQGSETVGLGSPEVRISNMTFGLAEESPVGVGIMGIGFELNEAEEIMFPTI
ncbi:acid protease, partial [Saitoella complicata NRRL Y-17804]|uniref:acid protease n=1 Tax=Saitoella complicata (strain BCRC 22490 / CBS 7301 / JCM 7358 / NBRC 10748 / NRRL Y-17804) TaxID=698492 RepID=UPI0008670158